MKIEPGKKIAVQYILRADGPAGEVIEETTPEEPMRFVFGEDAMLQKFEEALAGLEQGASFKLLIPTADAYGEEDESLYIEFPKEKFLVDGEWDEELFQEGGVVPMKTEEGEEVLGIIDEVKLNSVIIDFNHPLAGEDLYFEGRVIEVG